MSDQREHGPFHWSFDEFQPHLEEAYKASELEDEWLAEEPKLRACLASLALLLSHRYSLRGVLGVGGSGVVLRLGDDLFPQADKALKFARPLEARAAQLRELLEKEIGFLAALRHPGVVRIFDYGTAGVGSRDAALPYYLMEVVTGTSSKRYFEQTDTTAQEFLGFIRAAVGIVEFLHSPRAGSIVHLDLKPDNFVVAPDCSPVLIDLGTCKRIGADSASTMIACTRSYARPDLQRSLAKDPSDDRRARGEVKREEIRPEWDTWSLALSILSWMGFDHQTGVIEHPRILTALSGYERKYLLLMAARALAEGGPAWLSREVGLSETFLRSLPISSAAELRELAERLDGGRSVLAEVKELSESRATVQAAPQTHVPVTPALQSILEHRLFRRLSTITQLGLVGQVYPSAKHSRREHSLGTYANTIRIVETLYGDPDCPLFRQMVSAQDLRALLLTSLVHDVGHFPLAHDLEEIDEDVFNHTDLGEAMLGGAWSRKKKGYSRVSFDSLHEVFTAWAVTPEQVLEILRAKPKKAEASPKNKLLRSILSGPIDADKLDYLFRDARNLDLPYPFGVDTERLFRCLTTVVIDKVEGGTRDVPALGVHAKGKVAAEFLCIARYAMFSQAYWHHAVRAQKAMLQRGVQALLAAQGSDERVHRFHTEFVKFVTSLPESLYLRPRGTGTLFSLPTEEFEEGTPSGSGTDLSATDAAVLSWFAANARKLELAEEELFEGILRRQFFKRLWVVSRVTALQRWDALVKLWSKLGRHQRHLACHAFETQVAALLIGRGQPVTRTQPADAADWIEARTAAKQPWLLIDIPAPRPGSDVGLFYVAEGQRRRLRKDNRVVGDLEPSEAWNNYSQNLLQVAGKVRVFCHPMIADFVETSLDWQVGVEHLQIVLEQVAE